MTPEKFLETARMVAAAFPEDAQLRKNSVGNLAVLDAGGRYLGWVDLRFGGVELVDDEDLDD